jgi:hypothetical protein
MLVVIFIIFLEFFGKKGKTPKPDLLEFFGGNESNDVKAVEIKIISLTT